jgi:hypothetical protein
MASRKKATGSTARATGGARAAAKDASASLARRVAEAAAGLPNGRRVWFVVQEDRPHRLRKHYDESAADAHVAGSPGYLKMGPYLTPDETPQKRPIETIRIKFSGVAQELVYRGDEVDALFFTLAALDKFYYPYYGRLHGVETAAAMRKKYTDPVNTLSVVCHEPLSDECAPPPPCPPFC